MTIGDKAQQSFAGSLASAIYREERSNPLAKNYASTEEAIRLIESLISLQRDSSQRAWDKKSRGSATGFRKNV